MQASTAPYLRYNGTTITYQYPGLMEKAFCNIILYER